MRIAFLGHSKGRTDLHRRRSQFKQAAHFFATVDATGKNQRDALRFDAQRFEQIEDAGQHRRKIKPRVVDILGARCTQMAAGVTWMFDNDGVGQAVLAQPFFQHDAGAAHIRQNRHQGHVRKIPRHVGKIERQSRTHHDGMGTALAGLAHIGRMRVYRLHHVDCDGAPTLRQQECLLDLAIEGNQVYLIECGFVTLTLGLRQQIRVMMTQIDAGDGAHCTMARHRAGEPVRRDADTHAALNDRQ